MAEITATTKLPLTSGKEATLTLRDGEVEIVTPVSFKHPKATLGDLRVALEDLEAAADPLTTQIDNPHVGDADPLAADEWQKYPWAPIFHWNPRRGDLEIYFKDGSRFNRTFGVDGPRPMHGGQSLRRVAELVEEGQVGRAKAQVATILDDLIPEAGAHFRQIADVIGSNRD